MRISRAVVNISMTTPLDAETRRLLEEIRDALRDNGANTERGIALQEQALKNQEEAIANQRLAVSSYQKLTRRLMPVIVVLVVLVVILMALYVLSKPWTRAA